MLTVFLAIQLAKNFEESLHEWKASGEKKTEFIQITDSKLIETSLCSIAKKDISLSVKTIQKTFTSKEIKVDISQT